MLEKWAELPENIRNELAFLSQSSSLIAELSSLEDTLGKLCKLLKNTGYSLANRTKLEAILAQEKQGVFSEKVKQYLEQLEVQRGQLKREKIGCCSDIIESFFGKFKLKISGNSPKNMTEFLYTMANFGQEYTQKEIKQALESVSISVLKTNKIQPKMEGTFTH